MTKLVKVKIAVCVDATGQWYALGYSKQRDDQVQLDAAETLESGEAHYWVTAELSIPEANEVAGEVGAA